MAVVAGRSTQALERMFSRIASWIAATRKAREESLLHERRVKVLVSNRGISSTFPSGDVQSVEWDEVTRILVEANDSGPWGADLWWILEGLRARCTFPQGATGEDGAIEEIKRRFPTFEVKGMNSVNNATFVCWERDMRSNNSLERT